MGNRQSVDLDRSTACVDTVIPGYYGNVIEHYGGRAAAIHREELFVDFGLRFVYERPTLLNVYDHDWRLDDKIKELVVEYGVVLFDNVYLDANARQEGQRNIFPHLKFHLDRSAGFGNQYSLFVRDPYDEEQRSPRKSSSLVVPYGTMHAQAAKEMQEFSSGASATNLFSSEPVEPMLDSILLHQPWDAPEGVGQLAVFDNRTVYHASYYRDINTRGYPIGVRYLF